LSQHKRELRAKARARRETLAQLQPPALAGARAGRFVLEAFDFQPGTVVSAYWAMGDELDANSLIRALHARGNVIGLPVVMGKGLPLVFRQWVPETRFIPGGFGTQIPGPEAPEVVPERLIVPLLAFDADGYRLGYGGGFYDRTLEKLRAAGRVTAIGFAYAGQEVDSIPCEPCDQRLDWMATESFLRRIGHGG
jgi:5-formyltetrahydrofolate cyclo-ligase